MNSEVKRRVLILSIGIIGMISLITGISFAAFSINLNGTKQNAISTGCLKVEMSDNGNLAIENAYPVTDEEGLASDAYTYTIENTCSVNAYYEATLNAMEGTTLANLKKVKVALSGDSYLKPTFEDDLDSSTLLNQDSDVLRTYRLDEGYLAAGETKTFNLRTWIDYDVEQISGKIENKVIIQSEARTNNTLVYNTKTIGYFSGSREQLLKNVDYKQISSESGIVESKNNTETSYYFRGTPTNTVVFGTYNSSFNGHSSGDSIRWKILNTNSDGSVNLITEESIGNSTYSNVQNLLTSFYNTHLQDEETYIKTNSTFCKEGATSGEYLAKLRTESNNPTSKCNGNTTFTKIGLPTVDDLMYAGAVLDKANTSYYLYNGNSFMTGTQSSSSTIYASNASKSIYEASTSASLGVRPVITIKKDTLLSGNGTAETPYYVSGTYETPSTFKDTNKPVVVYARVEEKWSKTNKQIEISAKDNNTIAGYIVKTTNTTPGSNDTGWEAATSNKYKTVNTFDNGTYYVFAKDAAGNVSDPEQVKVERVDKVAPTCSIRLNSTPDSTIYKTLTVISEDTNIDLKGYSWDDDEDIKTSTRKIGQNGVYKAYLKDLAGNTGSCQITVTSVTEFYTVIYKANGGVGEDKEDAAPVGGEYTLLKNTFTRSGYSFIGWDTDRNAIEPTYSDKQEVTSLATSGNTITLYAIWDGNALEFDDQTLSSGTYGQVYTSSAFEGASNGTGSYTYTIKSGAPANATINSTNRTISFPDSTPVGTYNIVVRATDASSGKYKEATMKIVINKYTPSLAISKTSASVEYNSTGNFTATPTTVSGCVGTLTATSASASYVTVANASSGTYGTTASFTNAGTGVAKTFYYKGAGYTTGNNVVVSYVPTDTNNCNSATTKTVAISVAKVDATCPTTFTDYSGTYDGQSHTITATGHSGGTLQYRTSTTGTWSTTKPSITNVSDSPTTVYVQVKGDSNHNDKDCGSKTITINPQKCNTPTNVAISTAGRVSWTNSSTSACSTHQVKVGTGSYATATSGVDKNSDITSATGSRSVSVIAKAPNSNYTDSDAASKSVTVYAITFASNDTDKGTVSPTSKNVISGVTVTTSGNNLLIQGVTSGTTTTTLATITPTPKTGYKYSSWSKTSGSLTSTQTIAATFIEDAYIATFYYQSNTTNGSTTVSSTTAQCTVSSGTTCSVTIPTAVRNSGGTYNNAYAGLRTAYGINMNADVSKTATTVTLSADTDYYSIYSTEIKIYYPSSVSATTSKSTYQNQWFTSKTAMGTTVLSSSSTGTTTNATAATAVSGYTTLVGFSASNSTNTATWSTIASLTQSDSSRNASRSVYEIDKKTVTATFYYYSGSAQTSKTASGDQYLRCKSTSTAEIYDSDISVPTEVTSSTGPNSSPYSGLSTSTSSTTTTTTINTSVLNYYAIYGSSYTATFVKENSNVQAIGSTSLSCSNTYTTNGTSYSASGSGEDCTIIMPSITPITGYKSIGWYDSDGNWFNYSNSEITLTSNATFTAKVKRLTADEMYYDNTNSGVECDNAQCMIDYLDTDNNISTSNLKLGDYISYTPTKTSYKTSTIMTGYTSTQTINPSELNLWRVISLNQDGTVDIISENVSSTSVYFRGQTGYQNFVGYLNVLAKQYENSNQTVGSRHFGYNGQTEFITDTSKFVNPAPWTCSTGGTCSPDPDDYESSGGGDTLYTSDYNLINTVLGTRVATNPSGTAKTYWMASRYYYYNSSTYYRWYARYINTSGANSINYLYNYTGSSFYTIYGSYALRPIVTLKSGLSYSGSGTEASPYSIR